MVKAFLKKVPILKNTALKLDFCSILFDFCSIFVRFLFDFCLAAKPLSGKRRSADVLCHPQGRILA